MGKVYYYNNHKLLNLINLLTRDFSFEDIRASIIEYWANQHNISHNKIADREAISEFFSAIDSNNKSKIIDALAAKGCLVTIKDLA